MTDNFSALLDEIDAKVEAALPAIAFKAAAHLHTVALPKTPLETGNLREESYVENIPGGARVVYPGPYARYQEYGVSHSGKPLRHEVGQSFYLSSTVLGEHNTVLKIISDGIHDAIDGA